MLFFLQNLREENERLKIKVRQLEQELEVLKMHTCICTCRYLTTTEKKHFRVIALLVQMEL